MPIARERRTCYTVEEGWIEKLLSIATDFNVTIGTVSAVATGYRQYGLR